MKEVGKLIQNKRILTLMAMLSILLLAGLGVAYLLDQTGLAGLFTANKEYRVESSEIEMGRLIQGNKISIRDQIQLEKSASYAFDGPLWPLGNERKSVSLSFLAELGYVPEDIIRSEKIDTFQGDLLVSRTLLIDLPLPDTLSFVQIQTALEDQEWFWEGWIDSPQIRESRATFIDSLRSTAYSEFRQQFLQDRQLSTLEEATRTLLNYVNTGYRIGNDIGFSTIVASYQLEQEGAQHLIKIRCEEYGTCNISKSVMTTPEKI